MNDPHAGEELPSSSAFASPFIRTPRWGSHKHIDLFDSTKSCGMRSGCVTLREGESVGEHTTGQHEELIVVLEGDGEVILGTSQQHQITAGQVIYVPPETPHNVRNARTGPLRYIYIVAPAAIKR